MGITEYLTSIKYHISKSVLFDSILNYKKVELTKLTDEVIYYMHENVKEEKKKYEYFVDSIAEIEASKENTTQQKNIVNLEDSAKNKEDSNK